MTKIRVLEGEGFMAAIYLGREVTRERKRVGNEG